MVLSFVRLPLGVQILQQYVTGVPSGSHMSTWGPNYRLGFRVSGPLAMMIYCRIPMPPKCFRFPRGQTVQHRVLEHVLLQFLKDHKGMILLMTHASTLPQVNGSCTHEQDAGTRHELGHRQNADYNHVTSNSRMRTRLVDKVLVRQSSKVQSAWAFFNKRPTLIWVPKIGGLFWRVTRIRAIIFEVIRGDSSFGNTAEASVIINITLKP